MDESPSPEQVEDPKRAGRQGLWIAVGIVAVLGICLVGAYLKGRQPDPGAATRDAERVCQDFVKKRLKAPATAEFSGLSTREDGEQYTVTGDVDAENSFGANLRSRFTCVVRDAGDQWRLVSLGGLG